MLENNLLNALEAAHLSNEVVFQVNLYDDILVIVINRPDLQPLDYGSLQAKIVKIAQNQDLSGISTICLYSRVVGEEDPDWQNEVPVPKVTQSVPEPVENPKSDATKATKATEAIVKPKVKPKAISEYRFGLSDYLVETIGDPPEPDIAEVIMFFHELSQSEKEQILPTLEQFFVNQDQSALVGSPDKFSDWLQKIEEFNKRKRRATSIWLARYCSKGEEILSTIDKTLPKEPIISDTLAPPTQRDIPASAASPSPQSVASPSSQRDHQPRSTPSPREPRSSTVNRNSNPTTTTATPKNQSFIPMAIALVILGGLGGWLFSGVLSQTPTVAIFGLCHGFIWAVGVSYGNRLFLGSTVTNIFLIVFFRGFLWSQGIGVTLGFATALAIKLNTKTLKESSELSQVFGMKGLIAVGSVIFGILLGITLLGGGISGKNSTIASSGNDDLTITIVESEIVSMPSILPKGAVSLRAINKTDASCQLSLQPSDEAAESTPETSPKQTIAPTKLVRLNGKITLDVPLNLSPGSYTIFCEESKAKGGFFDVAP